MRSPWAAFLLIAACGDQRVFVPRVWPAGEQVVAIIAGADDQPLETAPRAFDAGTTPRFDLPSGQTVRFYLRTFASANNGGPDFDACGLRFGGEGGAVPPPASSWTSGFVELEGGTTVTLERESAPRDFELRYERCFDDPYPCEAITVEPIAVFGFEDQSFYDVTAVSDDLAYVASSLISRTRSSLARISNLEARELGPQAITTGIPHSLAWDGADTIYGVTTKLEQFELTREDETIARRFTLTSTPGGVTAGYDGAAYAFDEQGIFEITRGSTRTASSLSLGPILDAAAVRRDRLLAITRQEFYLYDGNRWVPEYTARPSAFEKWDAVGGDDDVLAAVDRNGFILLRDESRRAWAQVERPFVEGPRWRAVGGLGRGRFIASGDAGTIAVWTGERWCNQLDTGTTHSLRGLSVAPSKRVVFVVGADDASSTGDQPIALRVSIPAPPE